VNHAPQSAFGYMRVFCDVTDAQLYAMEHRLARFAGAQGLQLVTIFCEHDNGSQAVFNEMVEELQRTDTQHLIVPSLGHLSRQRFLQEAMLTRLEIDTDAEVHELSDRP
jgi:DNA invertase Pin-like site-specific DNA recombinase